MAKPVIITPPTSTDEEVEQGYHVGKWHAFPNYECVDCQYATVFLDKIEKHVAEGDHSWSFPLPPGERAPVDDSAPTY